MPHVAFVPFTGFRIREEEMLALGMSLPGLQQRMGAVGQLPALGLLTLAGMTPAPWTCSWHEAARWDEELVERLVQERPTLVAVSALTASIEEAYGFCRRLRQVGIPTVLGGLHVTSCFEEAKQHATAVVAGEGESVWLAVLADAADHTLKPLYRGQAPFDLAQAPVPRFDLLGTKARPRLTIQTQRGCPFACDFCGASRLLGSFREKPIANIAQELAAIEKLFPQPTLELADDNTFAGTRPAEPLLDALQRTGARYFTEVDWRVGERPDVLAGLARSGCVQVLVGIEALEPRHAGMGAKQSSPARIMEALAAVQEAGVAVIGCFLVGGDGETNASLDRLARFIQDSPLADIQLTLPTPFPGTAFHRRLRKEGRLLPERGWPYYTLFDVVFRPDPLSVEELKAGFRRLLNAVFNKEASRRRQAIRKEVYKRSLVARRCASERCSAT